MVKMGEDAVYNERKDAAMRMGKTLRMWLGGPTQGEEESSQKKKQLSAAEQPLPPQHKPRPPVTFPAIAPLL